MSDSKQLQSVKKFYFLEYFYIVLASFLKHPHINEAFEKFKLLKQKHRLGESKYKKLTGDAKNLTRRQQERFRYTFNQVIEESKEYQLIDQDDDNDLCKLTNKGRDLLKIYEEEGVQKFNFSIFNLMESEYEAFREIVEFLYNANPHRTGTLIFPHYSPLELKLKRNDIQTTDDICKYSEKLAARLQKDIKEHLNKDISLREKNIDLIKKLTNENILPEKRKDSFNSDDYNKIIKRIRDFWIIFFLKDLYNCKYAMFTFDLWIYRAKQIGIIHATEAYPFINGKLVFPTSVILKEVKSKDFKKIYKYKDGKCLYIHDPDMIGFQEEFVKSIVRGYYTLRDSSKNYFVSLSLLREIVLFNLKISSQVFESYLNKIYQLNLTGELKIRISLEADRLPEETNAIYLKHDPVKVGGSYRNIIAIDVAKGD